jgi:hypothetical protein
MKKQHRVICASPPRTASTVLNNCILGLIRPNHPVVVLNDETIKENFVTVTHDIDIDAITEKYSDEYELHFFCSERKELNKFIDLKYHSYKNVSVIQFEDLNETEDNSVENIVSNVLSMFNYKIEFDVKAATNRIKNMNEFYETIKDLDFSYYDGFYHLHGSHRNRKD